MGGRGTSATRNSATETSNKAFNPESLIGGSVTGLSRYTGLWKESSENIRKDFNLDFATDKQIESIISVFQGIQEYDKGYDDNKTPFTLESLKIQRVVEQTPEELARNKELFGRTMEHKDIQISIRTEPVTESSYIRMVDEKYRSAIIGKGGGFYTYRNGKKTTIRAWDMKYGNRP